jgi:hypothetical protein
LETLAKLNDKMDKNHERMEEKMDTNRKADQEELKGMMNAYQGKMDARIVNRKDDRKEMSCQEMTEAHVECNGGQYRED